MKLKCLSIAMGAASVLIVLSACNMGALWEDLAGKSTSGDVSLQGFSFTTSVDASGNASPSLKAGLGSTGVFNHNPSDGPFLQYSVDKSCLPYGNSSLGSSKVNYGSKYALKKLAIQTSCYGDNSITIEGFETDSSSANETAVAMKRQTPLALKLKLDECWLKKDKEDLQKIRDTMAKFREARKDIPQFQEVSVLPDSQLYSLHPTPDESYNRLVGDEVMWRELNRRLDAAAK